MNTMKAKKLGVTVMLVGALAAGAIGVSAQQGNPPPDQPGQMGQQGGMRGFGFQEGRSGRGERPGQVGGRMGQLGGRFGGAHEIFLMQAVMDATGLNLIDIASQVRGGSTLGEIVTANGGTIEAVAADALADATTAINEQVSSGNLTQEQADQWIARLETAYTNALNGELRSRAVDRLVDVGLLRLAAEMTELNAREIARQLRDGGSLSSILTENGVDVAAFTSEATERAQARIDVLVADGRATEEQAAELLSQFTEALNSLLNGSAALTPAL